MAFYKVTYNEQHGFATVHNYGCTFRCPTCSYKLKSGADGKPGFAWPGPERYLETNEIKDALCRLPIKNLYFMGGEPTVAKDLPELLRFAKEDLGVRTKLGHTNGSMIPMPGLDGANVGIKAWDAALHRTVTGRDKARIYDNVAAAYEAGMELKINVVYIPGLVDADQVEKVAAWLGAMDPDIPFHIMGYIPVPGQPWLRPTEEEMATAEDACRRHLRHVGCSRLAPDHALQLPDRDDRFAVSRIL